MAQIKGIKKKFKANGLEETITFSNEDLSISQETNVPAKIVAHSLSLKSFLDFESLMYGPGIDDKEAARRILTALKRSPIYTKILELQADLLPKLIELAKQKDNIILRVDVHENGKLKYYADNELFEEISLNKTQIVETMLKPIRCMYLGKQD